MSEPNKQYTGDGNDNIGQAAQKTVDAAKQISKAAAEQAAAAGAEATSTAAGASVAAAAQGGQAAAGIAAGTAAGGPVGAALAAAWAMRHTLFKTLVCICLALLFFIVAIVSLPSVVFNQSFRTDPDSFDSGMATDPHGVFDEMAVSVAECVSAGYDYALAEVEHIIDSGGYDYEYSMEALINYGYASVEYDICYVLAAYSASMEQRGATKLDMESKLRAVMQEMFPVTYEVKTFEREIEQEEILEDGTVVFTTEMETVQYVECTIHPFDQSVIIGSFHINMDAKYNQFEITYNEAIRNMANAMKMTLYGSLSGGDIPALNDTELIAFLASLDCSATRKEIIRVGLSLVGRVPYFWGGKSAPGWNDEWNTPKLVTSTGSPTAGTLRPYGLDCSGFTDWVYKTVFGTGLHAGTTNQWHNSTAISKENLLPGDLGFMAEPGAVAVNHVLIYAGIKNGKQMWVHCSSSAGGVVLNAPTYVKHYRRPSGFDLESETPPNGGTSIGPGTPVGPVLETITAEVTHYCACSKCCGDSADGITASGKQAQRGMVATSSVWPFGTQIMINGTMYIVEDRGGSKIENNRNRVDIFIPNHQEALRLGRFTTTAYIYRIGR